MDLFAFDDLYVRRLKEHDRETEDHFHRYFRPILFVKLSKSLPVQEIDDVIQEIFVRVLARLDDVRDGHKFGAFVLGFCNNLVLEGYRKTSRTEPLTEVHQEIEGPSNAEAELFSQEAAAAVRRVLGDLRERDAAILREIFLAENDRQQICRDFGISPEYLGVVLHRAKERFREAFRKQK